MRSSNFRNNFYIQLAKNWLWKNEFMYDKIWISLQETASFETSKENLNLTIQLTLGIEYQKFVVVLQKYVGEGLWKLARSKMCTKQE